MKQCHPVGMADGSDNLMVRIGCVDDSASLRYNVKVDAHEQHTSLGGDEDRGHEAC
jgi:hypothetical protein